MFERLNRTEEGAGTSTPAAGGLGARGHVVGFDYLRVAAAFAVVWIHGCDTNRLARSFQVYTAFAVPAFVLMSAYLSQRRLSVNERPTWAAMVAKRIIRVMPAYLAWSFVYLLMRFLKRHFVTHQPLEIDWVSVLFCGGASYQLWFVPALVLWTAAFGPLMLWLGSQGRQTLFVGPATLLAGVLLLFWGPVFVRAISVPPGYEILIHLSGSTGFFLIGIAIWALGADALRPAAMSGIALAGAAMATGAVFLQMICGIKGYILLYATGIFLCLLFWRLPKIGVIHRHLAPVAFGIYLCHGIFVEGFQVAAHLAGLDLERFAATVAVIVLSFAASAVLCVLLKARQETRWMVI